MSDFLDSTNVINLWLMDSTSSDSTSVWIADEVVDGSKLYINGQYDFISSLYDYALHLDGDTHLSSDSIIPETSTTEWIARYNDIDSEYWWVDNEWHVFSLRRDGTTEELIIDGTTEELVLDSTNTLDESVNIFNDSTDYDIDVIRITSAWRADEDLLVLTSENISYCDNNYSLSISTIDYNAYSFILNVSVVEYDDYQIEVPIDILDHVDTSFRLSIDIEAHNDYNIYFDSTSLGTEAYIDSTTFIQILFSSILDYDIYLPVIVLSYIDSNYNIYVADYVDSNIFVPIPDWNDYSLFIPTPGHHDIIFSLHYSDYTDASILIRSLGIMFEDINFISPHIVTSYVDSGGDRVNAGTFINIETYFGFADGKIHIGNVTDNLLESAHVLASTKDGRGSKSPVMLTEYGPYFGYSSTFRIIHYDWIRHYQRFYGYNSQVEAYAAIDIHKNAGGKLVEQIWDPPEDGWSVCRWRDYPGAPYQFAFFNNVGSVNTYMNRLRAQGKIDIKSSTWQTMMPYFPVYVVRAAYSQENTLPLMMIEEDYVDANKSVYIWTTDISDNNDDTWWQNEDGVGIPHWLRVIF